MCCEYPPIHIEDETSWGHFDTGPRDDRSTAGDGIWCSHVSNRTCADTYDAAEVQMISDIPRLSPASLNTFFFISPSLSS
jgi:hypothetical protein